MTRQAPGAALSQEQWNRRPVAQRGQTPQLEQEWRATDSPNREVIPGEMRSDREKIPAGFTKADADKAETMEAALAGGDGTMRALVAPGCQVYWPAPYEVCGAIRDKYNALGGPNSFLLFPKTNEITNPDGLGKRTEFLNGPIYWSPQGGAHPVVNHFLAAWARHGYENSYIGYPTTDEITNPDGVGRRQHFTGSTIYWYLNEAYSVGGAIADKWHTLGAETASGVLGYPISDERVLPDGIGRMNRFQRGVIYWHPSTGAHEITGDILDRWSSQGNELGPLGYPTSGAQSDGAFRLTQSFQDGVMHGFQTPIPELGALLNFSQDEIEELYEKLKNDFVLHGTDLASGFERSFLQAQESYDFTISQLAEGNTQRGARLPQGNETLLEEDKTCDDARAVKPGNARTNRGDVFYSAAANGIGPAQVGHGHNGIFVSQGSSDPNNIVTIEARNAEFGVARMIGRERVGVCLPRYLSVNANNTTRNTAASWAETKVGKEYDSWFPTTRIGNLERDSYNCSSLIWAAFKHASGGGLDIGERFAYQPYEPGVYPIDILRSHNTTEFS